MGLRVWHYGAWVLGLLMVVALGACSAKTTTSPSPISAVVVNAPTGPIGSPGSVALPDGSTLNTAGTKTAGLQEALNYAVNNGWSLMVYGRTLQSDQITDSNPPSYPTNGFYGLTAPLVFPPMQGTSVTFTNVTLNFDGSVSEPAFQFDSCMMCDIELNGQIVANGSAGISFSPTSLLPLDGLTAGIRGIVDSKFNFQTVSMAPTSAAAISFDTSSTSIESSQFNFVEVNGGVQGIIISGTGQAFYLNNLTAQHVHGQSGTAVQVGTSVASEALVTQNNFTLFLSPSQTSMGLDLWGNQNTIFATIANSIGNTSTGVTLESGVNGNSLNLDSSVEQIPIVCANQVSANNTFQGTTTCPQ